MSRKKILLKNTLLLMLGKLSVQAVGIILLPLYTMKLSIEEYGFVDLVLTYITLIAPLIILQIESAVFRFLLDSRDDDNKKSAIISSAFKFTSLASIIFSLVYLILIQFISFDNQIIILLCLISTIFLSLMLQIARGTGKTIDYAYANIIHAIINLSVNIILLTVFQFKENGIFISLVISNLIALFYIVIKTKIYKSVIFEKSTDTTKEMIKYSMPLIPNSLSWWIVSVSDRTIISIFIGVAANGIYAISNKFSGMCNLVLGVFGMSWSETAALHINDKDKNEFFSETFNETIKIFTSVALFILVLIPIFFEILIGFDFREAYIYVPILIIATFINMFVNLYSGIYIAMKKTVQIMITTVIAAAINIILNLIFIEQLGLFAASISTLISYLIMAIYRHYDSKKYVEIKYEMTTLFSIMLSFTVVLYFYYINNIMFNYLNLILVILISITLNYKVLVKILKKIRRK